MCQIVDIDNVKRIFRFDGVEKLQLLQIMLW